MTPTNTIATQPSAAPTDERIRRALDLYAESYDRMAKMGNGKVSASDVAFDVRKNMTGSVLKALAQQAAPGAPMYNEQQAVEAWACVRKHNHSIPDDALDSMLAVLRAALQQRQAPAQADLLAEILVLAENGMSHGLLADTECGEIVAKIKGLKQAEAAPAPTADAIPTGRWSKEAEMMESWANIGQADAAVPTAEPVTTDEQDEFARLAAAPASQHEAIVGAVARGWCAPANENKIMDEELAFAIVAEVEAELARRCRAQRTNKDNESTGTASPAAHPAPPSELRNAFMTLESSGGEGRTIVLKFNQRDDAYAVHDFLLKAGSQDYIAPAAAHPANTGGMVLAPHFRGYARLGIGAYVLNHSAKGEDAELVISVATESEKAGRTVGDMRDNAPDAVVQPDAMAVRLHFENVAGLDALEQQLRFVRAEHFPESIPSPVGGSAPSQCQHEWPEADGQTDINGACTKCGMSFQRYIHTECP